MAIIEVTEKSFTKLVNTLNHRVTSIEKNSTKQALDIKWIKRIIWYMASIGTAGLGILGKIALS